MAKNQWVKVQLFRSFLFIFLFFLHFHCFSSEAPVDDDQGHYQSYRLSKRGKMCSLIFFHLLICSSFPPLAYIKKRTVDNTDLATKAV